MKGKKVLPDEPDPMMADAIVLGMDLGHLTQEDVDYLHKLRQLAQRKNIENFLKGRR